MPNKNAKVIVPLAIVAWLGSIVVSQAGTPPLVEVAFFLALAVAIPVIVFYLMAGMGWSTLARRYRAQAPFKGAWRACPTGQMAPVSVDDPDFGRNKLRLVGGTLRLGITGEALYLSMLLSKIPILGRFFPDVQIPWSAVTSARTYKAAGWFRPQSEPGAVFQAAYDPNYTGTFVELVVGQPPVFIQLPEDLLGDGMSRLPLPSTGARPIDAERSEP